MCTGKNLATLAARAAAYAFEKHLFVVNTVSGSALMSFGDVAQQIVERHHGLSDGYDWRRTARIAAVGCVLGSIQHVFYRILDRRFPTRDIRTVAKKVFIDQALCTPITIIVFIYGLGILENSSWAKINAELKEKCLIIFSVDCAVFIPAQWINFKYLDSKYRLVFSNMISIMYDTFLSYIKYTHDILKSMEKQNNNSNKISK